jgi:hypothetical protein
MPPNLRLSLSIFSAGFGVDAVGDAYRLLTGTVHLVAGGVLLFVSAASTLLGLLFLWLGRHEWNELHRNRVRTTNVTFLLTIALGIVAFAPAAYYLARGLPAPAWLPFEIGAAVAATLVAAFLTYVLVVSHLVARAGGALLALAVIAAIPVGYVLGTTLASELPQYLGVILTAPLKLASLASNLSVPLAWLVVSYSLLFVAFVDAHRRIARGLAAAAQAG